MPSPSTASTKRACKNANQPPPVYMKNQFRLIYITTRVRESGPWSFHGRMNENSRECTMWIWVFRLRVFVPNSAGRPPVDDVITAATLIATHTDISRKVSGSGPWTISRPSSALLLCSPMIPDAAFTPYPPSPSCLPISLPGLFGDCRQRNRFPCDRTGVIRFPLHPFPFPRVPGRTRRMCITGSRLGKRGVERSRKYHRIKYISYTHSHTLTRSVRLSWVPEAALPLATTLAASTRLDVR